MTTGAVIVCYEPDLTTLRANLATLTADSCRVFAYDNSESDTTRRIRVICEESGVTYLGGGGNVGIGAAQNRAVNRIAESTAVHTVAFFDQDSLLPAGFVARLRASFEELQALDPRAGILGALAIDQRGAPLPMKCLGRLGRYLHVDTVISSGSIVRMVDLASMRGFREDLFIDLVDNEFSWRMARGGRRCYVDTQIPFEHRVGSGRTVTAFGRSAPVSAPFRGYYQLRNLILLGRDELLEWPAVVRGVAMRTAAIVMSGMREGELVSRLGYAARGIRDGLRGRGGRLIGPGAPPHR